MSLNNTIILADLREQEREFLEQTIVKKLEIPSLFVSRIIIISTLRFINSSKDNTNNNKSNNEQTKKESTSEKSGKCEDGFEGRERRTKFGVVFEDS
jgi:hypothetical protein